MSSEHDPLAEQNELELIEFNKAVALEGEKASIFMRSPEWVWFNDRVLKPLEDEAMETLKKSKTEEERIKAQQMLLAADKPRQILKGLVHQGDAARLQLSTRQNGG